MKIWKKHIETYIHDMQKPQSDSMRMVPIGYDPDKDYIFYNKRYFNNPKYQLPANMTFGHELAHRYDHLEIRSWENKDFVGAIEAAIKKIQSNADKYKDLYISLDSPNLAFQDILSVLSDNKIKVGFGHESTYWDKPNMKALEIFANASYLQANHIELPRFDGLLDDKMEIVKTMYLRGG